MKLIRLLITLALTAPALPALAGPPSTPLACPDLAAAKQVVACPSEEELQYTYVGYCSDNARMYGKDKDTCETYDNYRKLKNIALWESADGEFHAYLSCDLAPAAITAAQPQRISIGKAGTLNRVACDYGPEISFAHRTRASCKPVVACAEGKPCRTECN